MLSIWSHPRTLKTFFIKWTISGKTPVSLKSHQCSKWDHSNVIHYVAHWLPPCICSICQCLHQAPSATLLSVVGEGQPLMDRSGHCYKNFSVMNPHYTQPYKTLNLLITPMKTHVKLSDLRVMFEFIDCLWCVLVCGVCQWRLQSQRERGCPLHYSSSGGHSRRAPSIPGGSEAGQWCQ